MRATVGLASVAWVLLVAAGCGSNIAPATADGAPRDCVSDDECVAG